GDCLVLHRNEENTPGLVGRQRAQLMDFANAGSLVFFQSKLAGFIFEDDIIKAVILADRPFQLVAQKLDQLLEVRNPVEIGGANICHQKITLNSIPSTPSGSASRR